MSPTNKEEYEESDGSSKLSKASLSDFNEIDKVLQQIQTTYRANLEAQESYIDILNRKNKNINSEYIKTLYTLFTENKANQILIQKNKEMFSNTEWDDKLLHRYYARLIEIGIRKISYFWRNSTNLEFLSNFVLKFMREIQSCFNDHNRHKNLDSHFNILNLMFEESALIEKKIYEILIDDGYLLSMDEFYRINGVDLVGDQQYEGKYEEKSIEYLVNNEEHEDLKAETIKKEKMNQVKPKENKKIWGYIKNNPDNKPAINPIAEINKNKIKIIIESIVSVIKNLIELEKSAKANTNYLEAIEEETTVDKTKLNKERKGESSKEIDSSLHLKKEKKRISKPENYFAIENRKKGLGIEKKVSIELMSYFSSDLKSVISENDIDIECLSELLMPELKKRNKSIPITLIGKNQNETYIHSTNILNSVHNIQDEKKRGRLIALALEQNQKEENFDNFAKKENRIRKLQGGETELKKQKFSFKASPGAYLSFSSKIEANLNHASKKKTNNRLIIRHNYEVSSKDLLFENESIASELVFSEKTVSKKVSITQIDGQSFIKGIVTTSKDECSRNRITQEKENHCKNGKELIEIRKSYNPNVDNKQRKHNLKNNYSLTNLTDFTNNLSKTNNRTSPKTSLRRNHSEKKRQSFLSHCLKNENIKETEYWPSTKTPEEKTINNQWLYWVYSPRERKVIIER